MLYYRQMAKTQLRSLAPELWGTECTVVVGGVMKFRSRMTVVRLGDGSLLLHSPVEIDDGLAAALRELGDVAHIIAPNHLHHVFAGAAKERYPNATLWGAAGLAKKRKDLTFDEFLTPDASPPWCDELPHQVIRGNGWMGEVVFFHKASSSLIVTDLVFNIHEADGWFTTLMLKMMGAYQKIGQSKMVRFTTKDRDAFASSLQAMLEWKFERVIPCHGRIIAEGAREKLIEQVEWVLPKPALTAAS